MDRTGQFHGVVVHATMCSFLRLTPCVPNTCSFRSYGHIRIQALAEKTAQVEQLEAEGKKLTEMLAKSATIGKRLQAKAKVCACACAGACVYMNARA